MHSADRWKIALRPAGTRDVARLGLLEMFDGLERNWIQFDARFRGYHAKMREMLTKVPKKPSVFAKSKPVENIVVNEKKKMEEMGKAIEKSLMNNESGNSKVRDIKNALVRAFAEGRPGSSCQQGNNTDSKAIEKSAESSQKEQSAGLKHAVAKESNLAETRVSHVAAETTGFDDYSLQPMEVEEPEMQKGTEKEKKEVPEAPEQKTNKLSTEFCIEKSKAMEQTRSPAAIRSPLKRRNESSEKEYPTISPKRLKSSKYMTESAPPPRMKNGRYINPVSVYEKYRIPKKAYRMPDRIASSTSSSDVPQTNESAPSKSTLSEEQLNHNGSTVSPSSEQPAVENGATASPSVDQQSEQSDTSSTEIDDGSSTNPAHELQIKREMQDAITNPSSLNLNGNFHSFASLRRFSIFSFHF